jgi:hypothetical protein
MASSERVKDLFRQTMKEPKLAQMDKALYTWFTAMFSKGKRVTGLIILEKSQIFL